MNRKFVDEYSTTVVTKRNIKLRFNTSLVVVDLYILGVATKWTNYAFSVEGDFYLLILSMGCIWTWRTSCRIFHGLRSRKNVIPRREMMGIPSILRECSWICTKPTSLSDLLIIYRNLMSKSLLNKPLKKGLYIPCYTNDFPQERWGFLPSPCYLWNQWGLNRAVGRAKHGQIASGNETWLAGKLHGLFNPIHIYIYLSICILYIYICMCWLFFSIQYSWGIFPATAMMTLEVSWNTETLEDLARWVFPLNPAFIR